jgi:HK97 family phage major capsid protein
MPSITVDLGETIANLESQIARAKDQADQIVARTVAEDRDFTTDEEAALKEHQDSMTKLKARADKYRAMSASTAQEAKPMSRKEAQAAEVRMFQALERKAGRTKLVERKETSEQAERRAAFEQYVRFGERSLNDGQRELLAKTEYNLESEQRALNSTIGSAGAFTLPSDFESAIDIGMLSYSGILQSPCAFINTTSGVDITWPTVNDTSNIGFFLEDNAEASEVDPTFASVTLRAYTASSGVVWIPNTLLQDTGVPLSQIVGDFLSERLGRLLNRACTTGTGANQPQGLATFATASGVTSASSSTITYDNLVDLQHSIDPAYRAGGSVGFQFNDAILQIVRKIKDADGRPAWMPAMSASFAEGAPGLLLGNPYFINQDCAGMGAANNKVVIYGDHSKFKVRRVGGVAIARLDEMGKTRNRTGFVAFMRFDSRGVNQGLNPIRALLRA